MNNEKIYSQKTEGNNNVKLRIFLFIVLVILLCALLFVANLLPYSGILTLAVIFIFANLTLKLLNGFVFDITYVLYDDRLVFVRKYGRMEWENEVFPLDKAEIFEDRIVCDGKTYPFYPDEKMKQLIF